MTKRYDSLGELHRVYWRWRLALFPEDGTVTVGETTARFTVSTRSERRRAKRLGGERRVIEMFLDELSGSEVVWDVGACVGTYACLIARRLSSGCVVAFEPDPTNRSRLSENLSANAPTERWRTSAVALSDTDDESVLQSEFVEAGGGHHYLSDHRDGLPIEVRRGDSVVASGYPAPDMLKIDVQGAELQVLRGLGGLLDGVDTIYVELHTEKSKRYGTTTDEIEAFLREEGYSLTHLGDPTNGRPGAYLVRAHR
ncbi:methyltransferase, FkbM family [Halogranum rubrum]|uniref:Methyltransferase, FkbM family n=1 Tax=Halogranum rubrum TaxID=553466 RepID=A0A1I4IRD1_9EURY|nr:methyltransferase, FkbM family [Halogranum rubrum]